MHILMLLKINLSRDMHIINPMKVLLILCLLVISLCASRYRLLPPKFRHSSGAIPKKVFAG
jgi:hypothetical protein